MEEGTTKSMGPTERVLTKGVFLEMKGKFWEKTGVPLENAQALKNRGICPWKMCPLRYLGCAFRISH